MSILRDTDREEMLGVKTVRRESEPTPALDLPVNCIRCRHCSMAKEPGVTDFTQAIGADGLPDESAGKELTEILRVIGDAANGMSSGKEGVDRIILALGQMQRSYETMENQPTQQPFEHWAIVELMGHVRLAGKVTEETRFGVEMGRVDIPGEGDSFVTQYFGGQSVYRVTPVTEEIAREIAKKPESPISPWELKALCPSLKPPARFEAGVPVDYDDSDPFIDD